MAKHKPRRESGKSPQGMTPEMVREALKNPLYAQVFCGREVHEGDVRLHNGASVRVEPRHFAGLPRPRIIPIDSVTQVIPVKI